MQINGQMVILAREFRGFTQHELARRVTVSQATIARIEAESQAEVPDPRAMLLCKKLDVSLAFLQQKEDLIGVGSSAYFYRKMASLSAADMKRIHSVVNLLRIHIKSMLESVEVVPNRKLQRLSLEEYGTATHVAQALRQAWNVPDGPIRNITNLIESAGVIIVPCNFGTHYMDATSIWLNELPPIIFVSKDIPGDRWRFTVAHELAHLLMHEVPKETMEDEADEFAAELLMPSIEMKAFFSRHKRIRLQDLANQKPYWKVSIAALIERAYNLKAITDNSRRYLWATLKRHGYPREPYEIDREQPKNHQNMLGYFLKSMKFSVDDLAKKFHITRRDLEFLHGPVLKDVAPRRHLSAVR